MKYLILSCNTGQGHNACAEAIRETLVRRGADCDVCDALSFISPRFSGFISKGFVFSYRYLPTLFGTCYAYVERHRDLLGENSLSYRSLSRASASLYELCRKENYDAILCTHTFASMMLTHVKKTYSLSAKTALVITDYTCYPGVETSQTDVCFIPAEGLTEEFCRYGTRSEIIASGLPIRQAFSEHIEYSEARRLLGLPPNTRHLLMMCGSMGCGPIPRLLKQLAKSKAEDVTVTVICGTNRRLLRSLQRKYGNDPRFRICGYEKNISLLMDSADLYLTKPGGISVTEAAAKGLPLALIQAVRGCEAHNMRFFVRSGGAIGDDSPARLADRCLDLLQNPDALKRMSDCLLRCVPQDAAKTVVGYTEQMIKAYRP